ncbi:MAG: hypothetical protein Q4D91_01635 [Lautropia sp.]|nr:hypothetical protein [Lautropia sp.]
MTSSQACPLLLVGNSLSVLVAATERARLGLKTVVLNPGRGLGGYFAGVQVMGRRRDAGMVLFEASAFSEAGKPPSLDEYNPMKRNDVGRFMGVIRDYVRSQQPTRLIDAPQMWLEGSWMPDMMLGNGIEAMSCLSQADKIREELTAISARIRVDSSLCHPANKAAWPVDGAAPADWHLMTAGRSIPFDCDSISRLVHGNTLHEAMFLPYAKQVMHRDATHLSALYHRLPWLPLYWPESLLAVLDGQPTKLAPTLLAHPDGSTVADFCQRLIARLRQDPAITLIEDQPLGMKREADGFKLVLAHHGELKAARLAWAMTPGQGLQLAGLPSAPANDERLPLALGFFRFREDRLGRAFSFAHTVGDAVGTYRVTNSTACGAPAEPGMVNLVVEANPRRLASVHRLDGTATDEAVIQAMLTDLQHTGLIRALGEAPAAELRRFDGALPLPTHEAVRHFLADQRALLAAFPGIELMSASAAPFAMGLSDQMVQGLQVASRGISEDHWQSARQHAAVVGAESDALVGV